MSRKFNMNEIEPVDFLDWYAVYTIRRSYDYDMEPLWKREAVEYQRKDAFNFLDECLDEQAGDVSMHRDKFTRELKEVGRTRFILNGHLHTLTIQKEKASV